MGRECDLSDFDRGRWAEFHTEQFRVSTELCEKQKNIQCDGSVGGSALLIIEVKGKWADWFKLQGKIDTVNLYKDSQHKSIS